MLNIDLSINQTTYMLKLRLKLLVVCFGLDEKLNQS
jgi:hypothetical protein